MNKVVFFSTSKRVVDKKTDAYPDIILNSIKSELRGIDADAEVSCVTQIQNSTAFIVGKITADPSIDASAIVRNKINELFQKKSLHPSK